MKKIFLLLALGCILPFKANIQAQEASVKLTPSNSKDIETINQALDHLISLQKTKSPNQKLKIALMVSAAIVTSAAFAYLLWWGYQYDKQHDQEKNAEAIQQQAEVNQLENEMKRFGLKPTSYFPEINKIERLEKHIKQLEQKLDRCERMQTRSAQIR